MAGVAAAKALSGDSDDSTEQVADVQPVDTAVAPPPVVEQDVEVVVVEETVAQEPVSNEPGVQGTPGRTL